MNITFNYYKYEKKHLKCTAYYVLLAISAAFLFSRGSVKCLGSRQIIGWLRS